MKKGLDLNFTNFLDKFPEVELPVTFSDDTQVDFSKHNDPLPSILIEEFIGYGENDDPELTEFVPCIIIPETNAFHAVIYWKASVMDYQYILATYELTGELIQKKTIGGTYSDGKMLVRSLATIDKDWLIYVVSGKSDIEGLETYDATSSKAFTLELLPHGEVIASDVEK